MHCHCLIAWSIPLAIVMTSVSAGQDVEAKQERPPAQESMEEVLKRPRIGKGDAHLFFDSEELVRACHAIDERNSNKLRELIDQGMDINQAGLGGVTLLYWALVQGDLDSFKLLLSKGASPDLRLTESRAGFGGCLFQGDTVLVSSAVFGGSRTPFFFAALPYTKNPNQKRPSRQTLLHAYLSSPLSTTIDGLKTVLSSGVEINAQDSQGRTALHYAIGWYQMPLCSVLLDAGADPFLADNKGKDIPAQVAHAIMLAPRRPTRDLELEKQLETLRARLEKMAARAKVAKPADAS